MGVSIFQKITLFIFCLFSLTTQAKVDLTWFGTTSINIEDEQTAIFFDPFITRPSMWDVAINKNFKSDKKLVKNWLDKIEYKKIKGIFVSHTHYDHVLDLASVFNFTNAQIYGSLSTQNIALGAGINKEKTQIVKVGESIKIGKFKITLLNAKHSDHFLGWTYADGKIKKPLSPNAKLSDYKVGEMYAYFIEHEDGNILFHPSGESVLKSSEMQNRKADYVIQGLAKRKSTKDIIENIIRPFKSKKIIPVHHDDFFRSISSEKKYSLFVNFDDFIKGMKEHGKGIRVINPEYGKTLNLFK